MNRLEVHRQVFVTALALHSDRDGLPHFVGFEDFEEILEGADGFTVNCTMTSPGMNWPDES